MIVRIVFLIFLGFLCNPLPCTGQDSIAVEDLDEQKELKYFNLTVKTTTTLNLHKMISVI